MFCIDWESGERTLFGNERNLNWLNLDIAFVPCNYYHHLDGDYVDEVVPECVWDLEKQVEYLGPLDLAMYITEEVFI